MLQCHGLWNHSSRNAAMPVTLWQKAAAPRPVEPQQQHVAIATAPWPVEPQQQHLAITSITNATPAHSTDELQNLRKEVSNLRKDLSNCKAWGKRCQEKLENALDLKKAYLDIANDEKRKREIAELEVRDAELKVRDAELKDRDAELTVREWKPLTSVEIMDVDDDTMATEQLGLGISLEMKRTRGVMEGGGMAQLEKIQKKYKVKVENAEDAAESALKCIVCVEKEIRVLFLPCRHTKLCEDCAKRIWDKAKDEGRKCKCPYCRTIISGRYKAIL